MPTSVANEASTPAKLWKDKIPKFGIWWKIAVLCMNLLYMVQTFGSIYNASNSIATVKAFDTKNNNAQETLLMQNGIQIFMGCVLMICLIADFIVLTTSKLSVASSYWRPGTIFCAFAAINESIIISDVVANSSAAHEECKQRLLNPVGLMQLIDDICYMQMSLLYIYALGNMAKNIVLSIIYAVTAHSQNKRAIDQLSKENSQMDTPMETIPPHCSQY